MRRRPRTKVLLAGWHLPDRGESGFYNGYVQKPAGGPLAGLSDRSPMAESPAAPRLTAALDEGLARRLTLVCAPAGFGKTALLAHWARSGNRPVAWLSADTADNDPARFWRHVVAARPCQAWSSS